MAKNYVFKPNTKFSGLPLPFKFLFEIKFVKKSSEKIKNKRFGVEMDQYHTDVYPTKGHYKCISKILDLDNFR